MVEVNFSFTLVLEVSLFSIKFLGLMFLKFGFIIVIECRARIPEWYDTCQSCNFWMSDEWMKFVIFELHPLIVHAS